VGLHQRADGEPEATGPASNGVSYNNIKSQSTNSSAHTSPQDVAPRDSEASHRPSDGVEPPKHGRFRERFRCDAEDRGQACHDGAKASSSQVEGTNVRSRLSPCVLSSDPPIRAGEDSAPGSFAHGSRPILRAKRLSRAVFAASATTSQHASATNDVPMQQSSDHSDTDNAEGSHGESGRGLMLLDADAACRRRPCHGPQRASTASVAVRDTAQHPCSTAALRTPYKQFSVGRLPSPPLLTDHAYSPIRTPSSHCQNQDDLENEHGGSCMRGYESQDMLSLVYDEVLGCYYDRNTGKYYKLLGNIGTRDYDSMAT
jgi:hypothetical protein